MRAQNVPRCAVGSFAIGNNMFGVVTVAAFGVIGYVMEANGYPVAAMVLGVSILYLVRFLET